MSDKRAVSTDALETLGTIIGDGAGRDAIHLAVEPMIAAHTLKPGQDVGLLPDGTAGISILSVGIVDPFLEGEVRPGQRFWLVLYPRQITSLRHVWSHPSFPDSERSIATIDTRSIERSEEEIADAASRIGVSKAELLVSLERYLNDRRQGGRDSDICFGGDIEARDLPDGFWAHYENVMKVAVPVEFRDVYFRCAC